MTLSAELNLSWRQLPKIFEIFPKVCLESADLNERGDGPAAFGWQAHAPSQPDQKGCFVTVVRADARDQAVSPIRMSI
jgi:hypothetical protein